MYHLGWPACTAVNSQLPYLNSLIHFLLTTYQRRSAWEAVRYSHSGTQVDGGSILTHALAITVTGGRGPDKSFTGP